MISLQHAALEALARPLIAAGALSDTAAFLADTAAPRLGETEGQPLLALSAVLEAQLRGHTALDLLRIAEALPAAPSEEQSPAAWPRDLSGWVEAVRRSPLTGITPKHALEILDLADGGTLLVTRRMADEQRKLAATLRALAKAPATPPLKQLEDHIERLFPESPTGPAAQAVRHAAGTCLTVLTGGPGTGKTTSIFKLLAALFREHPALRVQLAAPTGKAAVRMQESLTRSIEMNQSVLLPQEITRLRDLPRGTVHRTLGSNPSTGKSKFDRTNPLDIDVLIVDEVSMMDVVLLRRLLDAVPAGARVVLLGDPDQLASVEAGSALTDLVASQSALFNSVFHLTTNYRADGSALRQLYEHLQGGRESEVIRLFSESPSEVLRLLDPDTAREALYDGLAEPWLGEEGYVPFIAKLYKKGGHKALFSNATAILRALDGYRVLAVHRKGLLGVAGLNEALSARVRTALTRSLGGAVHKTGAYWLGLPILITENAPDVELYNGDIGLILPDANNALYAFFPSSEGTRAIHPSRLPAHLSAFAMTVHKSQGSQFQHVALVLSALDTPLQSKELVYTGLTRAQRRATCVATPETLARALQRPLSRHSALAHILASEI